VKPYLNLLRDLFRHDTPEREDDAPRKAVRLPRDPFKYEGRGLSEEQQREVAKINRLLLPHHRRAER
jgi:hypothetical protein